MFVKKNYSFQNVFQFTGHHFMWLIPWAASVAITYEYFGLKWLTIPWLPLSVIGIAVAFYVGFKNNSAYDRMWEARKIWGGIVNSSRTWGISVRGFVTDQFAPDNVRLTEVEETQKRLIYRHIGWLYALRHQLLQVVSWEHAGQKGPVGRLAKKYRQVYGLGLVEEETTRLELKHFLPPDEFDRLLGAKNTATQIIDAQSQDLARLRRKGLIEDFRHMELQNILAKFYDLQGMNERIKKFPLPRQYGGMSTIFVGIFIFLLPFGLISEFAKFGEIGIWLSVPFVVLTAWVFLVMELIGDYTENPFEGMGNDIPMLSLCRTIEIDLREMLGEKDLPPPIEQKNGVLM